MRNNLMAAGVVLLHAASAGLLWSADELKVPETEARAAALTRAEPVYPPIAKQMKVSGLVALELTIDEQGKVEACRVINGNPLLSPAATTALKKWTFKPFTEGGKPSKAITQLTVKFTP